MFRSISFLELGEPLTQSTVPTRLGRIAFAPDPAIYRRCGHPSNVPVSELRSRLFLDHPRALLPRSRRVGVGLLGFTSDPRLVMELQRDVALRWFVGLDLDQAPLGPRRCLPAAPTHIASVEIM
jgi:hypothetical protein